MTIVIISDDKKPVTITTDNGQITIINPQDKKIKTDGRLYS